MKVILVQPKLKETQLHARFVSTENSLEFLNSVEVVIERYDRSYSKDLFKIAERQSLISKKSRSDILIV